MKIALCTTTINVPKVLSLYRALGPDVMFFIVGDRKTPDEKVVDFLLDIPNHVYYGADLLNDYKCAKFIGHNSIQRRNLGYLEALKWGADVIVSWDDDNLPFNDRYFDDILEKFIWSWAGGPRSLGRNAHLSEVSRPFNGLQVTSAHGWFDPGQLLVPPARHRGYPHDVRTDFQVTHIVNAKIGVAAGLCLGNPDISAVDRISQEPYVYGVSELARAGVVCDRNVHTVWNSQNTATIRELAPAMFLWPGSRHDDIYASLAMQRIMRERELHVHFGSPFVHQERNPHDLLKDLRAEIEGMEKIKDLAGLLGQTKIGEGTVAEQCRYLFSALSFEAGLAWLEDVESVL